MGFNVLVVDDSKVASKMIKRTLELSGIPLDVLADADDGLAGLEQMKATPFHVVIADINMPVMNGFEMIEQMQSDARLRETPVVVISTEGSATRIEELRSLGICAYIRKPFTPERVRDVLKQVLGEWEDETREGAA